MPTKPALKSTAALRLWISSFLAPRNSLLPFPFLNSAIYSYFSCWSIIAVSVFGTGCISPVCLVAWIKSLINSFLILFSTLSTKRIWGQIMLLSLKILFIFKMGVTCIRYDLGKIKKGIRISLCPVPYLPHPVYLHRYNRYLSLMYPRNRLCSSLFF